MKNPLRKIELGEPKPEDIPQIPTSYFKLIAVDLLDDPEQPMRTDLTDLSVEDLVVSMKQVGIIEPLVVKQVGGRFEVIAGHRRLYSARLAKIVEVPCYVRSAGKEETEMLKIHENMYRADVNPADEARHFSVMIDKYHMTPVKIAQLISKSLSYVTDRLAILDYPSLLSEAMMKGDVSFSVAREFARFDDLAQMSSAIYYAKRGGMTAEMAKKWVVDYKRSKEHPSVTAVTSQNDTTGREEVEHFVQCVYCRENVTLMQAEVVYMHHKCLQDANRQALNTETPK